MKPSRSNNYLLKLQNKTQFNSDAKFADLDYADIQRNTFKKSHETYQKYKDKVEKVHIKC